MRKFLLLFVSLFMTMGMFAQTTVLWSEDFSTYAANAVPNGGDYSYVCEGSGTKIYNANLAGGTSPEILVGKNGGSFSATIPTKNYSGETFIQFKCNKNILKLTINDNEVELTAIGTDYSGSINLATGTENVVIKFYNSTKDNARLDNIKFYQGTAKKAPGLSWGTASRQVTLGAEDNSFPTLTNDNNLDVTYSSSDKSVATINTAGEITLVAAGSTTITAAFAGNDEYEAGSVSYTLTVKAATSSSETNTPETAYTVAKALQLIADGENNSEEKVYVKGKISKIDEVSTKYGNATYYISDDGTETGQLEVFRGKYVNDEKFTAEDQIKVGDEVIVYGVLINYNKTTPEISPSYLYSHNGKTTGISEIAVDKAKTSPVYNTAGQRVDSSYKGIVIKNGKKVLVK